MKSKCVKQVSSFLFEVQEIKSQELIGKIQIMENQDSGSALEIADGTFPIENESLRTLFLFDYQLTVDGVI